MPNLLHLPDTPKSNRSYNSVQSWYLLKLLPLGSLSNSSTTSKSSNTGIKITNYLQLPRLPKSTNTSNKWSTPSTSKFRTQPFINIKIVSILAKKGLRLFTKELSTIFIIRFTMDSFSTASSMATEFRSILITISNTPASLMAALKTDIFLYRKNWKTTKGLYNMVCITALANLWLRTTSTTVLFKMVRSMAMENNFTQKLVWDYKDTSKKVNINIWTWIPIASKFPNLSYPTKSKR